MSKPKPYVRKRPARQREGAVMMIVLLILLTATTLAAASLQTTQFDLRASGYNRAAIQTEYVSEAAAMTTLAWIDATSMNGTFMTHLRVANGAASPDMALFGEPEIPEGNRANANRTQWVQQEMLEPGTLPPISVVGYSNGRVEDKLGSLGPRNKYVPGVQDGNGVATPNYVVDLYDCRQLSNTGTSGYQVNEGGSGTMRYVQYYCVVTSRGRTYVPYPAGVTANATKTWSTKKSGVAYEYKVNRFTMAHDARGSVITPPMPISQ
jgi:hypothetical protein